MDEVLKTSEWPVNPETLIKSECPLLTLPCGQSERLSLESGYPPPHPPWTWPDNRLSSFVIPVSSFPLPWLLPLPSCSMFSIPISEKNLTANQQGQHSLLLSFLPQTHCRRICAGPFVHLSSHWSPFVPRSSDKGSWPSPINFPQVTAVLMAFRCLTVSPPFLTSCPPSSSLSPAGCHSLFTTGDYSVGLPTCVPPPTPPKACMAQGSDIGSRGK